ncbi:unnamed protein product [Malus baccata var. baccata]
MGDNADTKSTSSSMTSRLKWESPNHPLYLHHSDQPGAVLVPQPLVEDNYSTWIQSMTMALTVKNKLGLVDGTVKKPSEDEHEKLQQWNRCNNLVKTWLLGSMSKEISSSVINCKDARQIWLDLQERFSHANIVQLFHVENEIHDCVQGNMTVSSYFTKLKGLWDERDVLCSIPACGCDTKKEIISYVETQKTIKFIMGLSDSFSTVRSNVLLLEPLPTVNKAYSLVLRHEKQAEVSSGKNTPQPEAAAFAVKHGGREPETEDGAPKIAVLISNAISVVGKVILSNIAANAKQLLKLNKVVHQLPKAIKLPCMIRKMGCQAFPFPKKIVSRSLPC